MNQDCVAVDEPSGAEVLGGVPAKDGPANQPAIKVLTGDQADNAIRTAEEKLGIIRSEKGGVLVGLDRAAHVCTNCEP